MRQCYTVTRYEGEKYIVYRLKNDLSLLPEPSWEWQKVEHESLERMSCGQSVPKLTPHLLGKDKWFMIFFLYVDDTIVTFNLDILFKVVVQSPEKSLKIKEKRWIGKLSTSRWNKIETISSSLKHARGGV